MSSSGDIFIRLQHITSLGQSDLNGDEATPQADPGTLAIVNDRYGYRVFRYLQNKSGAAYTKGECVSRPVNVAVANITSGTTTKAVTSGLTADAYNGRMAVVTSNDDVAGSAPEAEVSFIDDNTTTDINFDPQYAFSVALAANDDLEVVATWQSTQSAASDRAVEGLGAVMGLNGISDGRYGWALIEGNGMVKSATNVAFAELEALTASAGTLKGSAASTSLHWGYALASTTASHALSPVCLKLFTANGAGVVT